MMLGRHRTAMMLLGRIEMGAGRGRIRRGAITFFVNMKAVLSRCEILNVSDHPHFVANFCKCDYPGDFAAGFRF